MDDVDLKWNELRNVVPPIFLHPSIMTPQYLSLIDPVGVGENKTPKDRYKIGAINFFADKPELSIQIRTLVDFWIR